MSLPEQLNLSARVTAAADTEDDSSPRVLQGLMVPYGQVGQTSAGPVTVQAGAVQVPADPQRVKLTVDHDRTQPVGYLTQATETEDGLSGWFAVPRGIPAADHAWSMAASRLQDGLSVELDHITWDDSQDPPSITAAQLVAVSQVAVPAFSDARTSEMRAAHQADDMGGHIMPDQDPTTVQATTPDPEPEQPAQLEAMAAHPAAQRRSPRSSEARFAAVGQAIMARDPAALSAALSDATGLEDYFETQFVGELWDGDSAARTMISASTQGTLTGLKVQAYQWSQGLEVAAWAGDKAAIPSNVPAGALVDITPTYLAGGVDVPREYVDLGSGALVETFFRQAVDHYRLQSETLHAQAVKTAATVVAGATDAVDAVIAVCQQVQTVGQVTAVFASAAAWSELVKSGANFDFLTGSVNLSDGSAGLSGVRIIQHPQLVNSEVMAFDRRAVHHWEKNPPVRVNAVNVTLGGLDQAVHGYRASHVSQAAAVAIAAWTPAAAAVQSSGKGK